MYYLKSRFWNKPISSVTFWPVKHTRRRIQRVLGLVGVLTALVVSGAWGYDVYASSRALIDYPPPGQFIQISGARMHYLCEGTGEPTLVLEAGFGGGILDWSPLMPALARHQRVCAFDRFGQDWSDPAPYPRSFSTAADELHSALSNLGIKRPVVIGHSLGGALAQVYAANYEVKGVVLIEGLTVDVVDPVVERLGSYQSLGVLARLGLLRPLAGLEADAAYPPALRDEMIGLRARSAAWLNVAAEGAVAQQSAGLELRAAEPKLTMPLLIIAAEQSNVPGLPTGAFAQAAKALAERRPSSTFVMIPGAHHYAQAEQPQAVIEAIENWLTTLESI